MENEEKVQQKEAAEQKEVFKEKEKVAEITDPAKSLAQSLDNLAKFGGFDIIGGLIDGAENLNPQKKAAKSIFLSDNEFSEQRETLAETMELWIKLLSEKEKVTDLVDVCKTEHTKIEKSLKENLKKALDTTKSLETSYRSVGFFFKNAESDNIEVLSIMNAPKEDLQDSESKFFKAVETELTRHYDRLNLKNNYSLFVIPGWLGSKQAINIWGKIAFKNKVIFLTDYKDRPDFSMLKDSLQKESLAGGDDFLANVIVACNWIVGRGKSEEAGEEEHLYVPPSAAIAGKLFNTEGIVMAQGAAGKKYGTLNEVQGARLDLLKAEIASLIDFSVIPVVFEDNRAMAFSNKTLFNGNPIGLQEYPIVRVFDWIGKVFMNFFNSVSFQNWNSDLKDQLKEEIINFLDDYKGPGKLIEDFQYGDISQDPITKDINIKINIKPFFAAKNFFISLTGHDGKSGKEWSSEVK